MLCELDRLSAHPYICIANVLTLCFHWHAFWSILVPELSPSILFFCRVIVVARGGHA